MIPGGGVFAKYLVDISKFNVDSAVLGKGACGVVHKGKTPPTKKHPEPMDCAVKYLNAGSIKTNQEQMKFHNEIGCQVSLKHVAILPLIGYSIPFMGQGHYAVVTQLMKNGSLFDLIQKVGAGNAPDDWDTIRAINIFGIAAGMAYVHQKNIIHRDLKTENVMLDENYYPKIADFGLSKVFEEGTQNQIEQTLNIGTPTYMAPEIIEGDTHYSNKVDVFAYSIILYELMTNNKPWSDKGNLTTFNLLKYVSEGQRPTIRDREIPELYVELINYCWDSNPENRPTFLQMVKGFMDHQEEYFDMTLVDEEKFQDYIEAATKDLDFSKLSEEEEKGE